MTQQPPQSSQPPQGWPPPNPAPQPPHGGNYQQAGQQPPYYAGPPQPIQPKKHTARNVVLILLGLVVLLCVGGIAIVVVASGGNKSNTTGNSGGSQEQGKTVGLNTPVRDGKFEFVVKSVTCGNASVGDGTLGKQAQGQFCEVALTVKNIGNKAQTFDGSSQKAKGSNGAVYSNDTGAELYANSNTQTFLEEINPGNQVNGIIVFDIPKDAKIVSVELHDSPFSGGVTVTVG